MYWFGEKHSDLNLLDESIWSSLRQKKKTLALTPTESILDTLDNFGKLWNKNSKYYEEALPHLIEDSGFSREEVEKTLSMLPMLLKKESLQKRIEAEFGKASVLDRFTKTSHFQGKVRAVPQGILLHVTAGNVFLSSIDSLIMGLITKNISLLKVSSQNKFFPEFFAQKLAEFDREKVIADKVAILSWKGGDEKIESLVKSKVNAIIAWGGEEMIASYQKNLPQGVKLLDFGPKISFQLISKKALQNGDLKKIAQRVVDDIIPWDQAACASPQNLYIEEGIDEQKLMNALDEAFATSPKRGVISDDESVEILKEKYRALYSDLMGEGAMKVGESHLLHLESNKFLKPSPLNRSLILKRFKNAEELSELLEPFSYYLQSCSYLLTSDEKDEYLTLLSLSGIKRFAPLGTITWGMDGAPHDGRFVLRELVQFVGDEFRAQDVTEAKTLSTSATLKNHFENSEHPQGYIFSSGGTTGEPKFVHFSYEEFDFMTDMLAHNFKAQGLKAGMTVANLFVAGNLWSSFMAVEKALEKIGAVQLPIGGLCQPENILLYLKKFKPDVVMGIPSLMVMTAEHARSQNINLKIPYVFYAGEALSDMRRDYLSHAWQVEYFGSAGYASVDAGVIGYQCEYSGVGEHHVFGDFVDLQIVNDEGVVTSLVRNSMPVENYRTGDRFQWVEGECQCGRKDKRFKLMGRIDNVLQVWSCRVLLNDIEKSIREIDSDILSYQVVLTEKREMNLIREKMEILYESKNEIDQDLLIEAIYENSRDLKDTISLDQFMQDVTITQIISGSIPRNPRTGKISLVLDQRR